MENIIVIGATGFIGTHTLNWLSKQPDIHLIAACRDKSALPSGFSGEIREGDIRDITYLSSLFSGVDVVVNAMSWSSLYGHKQQSEQLFYLPTIQLFEAYLQSSASRFINISTTSAASPSHSEDALSEGIPRDFWPHLNNVIKIENKLREKASTEKTVINLRLGIFVGEHYGLGVLPILLPRLKTHLVPWVQDGKTELPLTDGRDLGQALGRAALADNIHGFQSFNIVGETKPTVRDVITFLHDQFAYPKPHFSVPFSLAYPFAWLMEKLDSVVPWEPLIVRSVVHLLENTHANNDRATDMIGYKPMYNWQDAVRLQVAEMKQRQNKPMRMAMAVK